MRLNIKKAALVTGSSFAVIVLASTLALVFRYGPTHERTWLSKIYRGYNLSYPGVLIGVFWAFLDGLIGGALVALLLNWLSRD